MLALDTNTLVRLLIEDDASQAARVSVLLDRTAAAGEVVFVSDVVVCELVWVLRTGYGVARMRLVAMLRELFHARHLRFSAPEQLRNALDAYERGRGDFADYLVRQHALAAGCDAVITFDRALHQEPGFLAPE